MRVLSHEDQALGTGIGACMGFVKGILSINVMITWQVIFETAVLAAIGSAIGFFVTSLLKWLKSKI